MATSRGKQRIRRAENLAAQYPFAAEMLGFYLHLARFQFSLYEKLAAERKANRQLAENFRGERANLIRAYPLPAEIAALFPQFLTIVEHHGTQILAEAARDLRSSQGKCATALQKVWSGSGEAPETREGFLAFAFLQPYAEFLRAEYGTARADYGGSLCPFCSRKPVLGVLRQQGDAGRRNLICGFCAAEWEFRRVVCAGCGEQDHAKLPVYTAETFPHIRVECCDSCRTYIKSIDLTKNGLAEPLVDELASVPLNLWAEERGYTKLHANLLGL